MIPWRRPAPWAGPALWILLVLPPVRHALEATMTVQMLVQIPLLALAGWWLAPHIPARAAAGVAAWNRSGIAGLLLVTFASMIWMLPRALDAAIEIPWVSVAKFASIPLLVGLPLALSWPLAGFVVRGVFLVEVAATGFRLGWLYLVSPQQLCANYLIGDQQRLGRLLLVVGATVSAVLAWKLIWGHIAVGDGPRDFTRSIGDRSGSQRP